jgi:transposase
VITGATQRNDPVEVLIMRAFDPEVVDAVWNAVAGLIPVPVRTHPLGCHRRRVPDRVCFWGILVRLVTGCSWVDTERLLEHRVSDTTLRARRDEWITAGVFDRLVNEAVAAYDRIIGLELTDSAVDASQHKAPAGGEGTGPNYWDRAKHGWKWSLLTDEAGIPAGWTIAAANRPDSHLLAATLDDAATRGLVDDIDNLHLDRGYNLVCV